MDAETLSQAMVLADAPASLGEAAAALRSAFGPLRIVVVDALDMRDVTPAARGCRRQLYLGASDGHCWTVTTDTARAAGLFVADLAV